MIPVLKRLKKGSSTLIFDAPYDPNMVDAVRACIPPQGASWTGGVITVDARYYQAMIAIGNYVFKRIIDQVGNVPEIQSGIWKGRFQAWKEEHEGDSAWERNAKHAQDRARQAMARYEKTAYEVLHVLPSAPKEVVHAAYRALAKMYHSDTGGNDEKMKELNAAYDKLR